MLRLLAATMVLAEHLMLELSVPRLAIPLGDPTKIAWTMGVDIFFIVSGFIMFRLCYSHFGERGYWAGFLRRRFLRIVPLYWLFTSLMLAMITLAPTVISHNDLSLGRIVSSYLFVPWPRGDGEWYPILGVGWTLNYEVMFYLAFSVALIFPRRIGLIGLFVVFAIAAAFGRFIPISHLALRFWTDPIILEFLFGIGLGWAYLRGVRFGAPVSVALIAAGFALSGLFARLGWIDHIDRDLWGGIPALFIASGVVLGRWSKPRGRGQLSPMVRLLVLGGDASYALYLSHMFLIRSLTAVWVKLHLGYPLAYVAIGVTLATGLAIAVYLFLEQPFLTWAGKVMRPRRMAVRAEPLGQP